MERCADQAAGLVAGVAAALDHVAARRQRRDGHLGHRAVGLALGRHAEDHLQQEWIHLITAKQLFFRKEPRNSTN